MTETSSSGNSSRSQFPYEPMSELLTWVPSFVDGVTPQRAWNEYDCRVYDTLINTILVLCGARPAAFMATLTMPPCEKFVSRLNRILDDVPGGRAHKLEIVRRCGRNYFITRKNNSQFIWNQPLTHRDIGVNLDMFAPGHVGRDETRGLSIIVEVSGAHHIQICPEQIITRHIENISQIEIFFLEKVGLFNNSMQKLNLRYRFEWFWAPPEKFVELTRIMGSDLPPDALWYRQNYYFVNCHSMPCSNFFSMSFCSHNTAHERYWHVIRTMHNWIITQKHNNSIEYFKDVENLFNQVQNAIQTDSGDSTMTDGATQIAIMSLIEAFGKSWDDTRRGTPAPVLHHVRNEARVLVFLRRAYETVQMHSTQRWKLHSPSDTRKIPYPSIGDGVLYVYPCYSNLLSRIVGFLISQEWKDVQAS